MNTADLAKQFGGVPAGTTPVASSTPSPSQVSNPVNSPNPANTASLASQFGGTPVGANPTSNGGQPPQSFLQGLGSFVTDLSGQRPLGEDIGQGIANVTQNNQLYNQAVKSYTDVTNNLLKAINAKQASSGDTTALQTALNQHIQDAPKQTDFTGQNKTLEQYAGDVGQSALGLATPFIGGSAIGAEGGLGSKLLQGAKLGAGYGATSGVTGAMSNNEDLGGIAQQGLIGGAIGAGLGVGAEGLGAGIGKVAGSFNKENILQSIADDIAKPTTIPKASYAKATDIYDSALAGGNNISRQLVNNGISYDAIRSGSVFDTLDTVAKMRNDTGKTAGLLMRPALEMADHYTPRVPLSEVEDNAIASVMKDYKIPDKESVISRIQKRFESTGQGSLQQQFPDGFKLTDLQDQKISNTAGVNFNNPDKDVNYHISNGFRTALEDSAPKELNIRQFNRELQKNYQAADYLEALNGKSAPQSLKRKLAIQVGKIAGAGVGDRIGGLLGGVGGYHAGGTLVNLIENMPNPLKENVIRSLQKTDPEIFQAFKKYLGDEATAQATRLKLPAPSYIPMGEKTTTNEGAKILQAEKNPVSVNPQTNKFQTTYNSKGYLDNLSQSGSVKKPISNISKNTAIRK